MRLKRIGIGPLFLASNLLYFLGGCSDKAEVLDPESSELVCSISQNEIFSGGPGKDGIPALTNPDFVQVGQNGLTYLRPEDRVVGIILDSQPYAIPLNIFWWHEIVNLERGGETVSITHCPLTGSSLGFDRSAVGGAQFGVSGLLFKNNLVMYDRRNPESLWPQMLRGARCGSADGTSLDMVPVMETNWQGWLNLHPETRVVSEDTGYPRDYTDYPYGSYDNPTSTSLLFPGRIDGRRPPKERVLGIPVGSGGLAFPFGALQELGFIAAVATDILGEPAVVLWDGNKEAAMAYRTGLNGESLTFSVVQGKVVDDKTGSIWSVGGSASEGPLAGESLEPVSEAFVAFWFAWPEFYPDIELWGAS